MALPGERRLEGSLSIVAGIFCCLGIVYAASPSALLLSIVLPFLMLSLVYLFRFQDMQMVSRDLAVSLFGILYIPVLLAHGTDDRRVRVRHSQIMHRALEKSGKNVKYLEFEGGDHFLSNGEHRLRFFREMDAFLNANLQ